MTLSSGTLVTGEAVALELRTATVPSRGIATLIDFTAQFLLWLGVSFLIGTSSVDPALADAVSITALVLVWVGYPVVLETVWGGRTLGKAALGLRVGRDDGGPIRFRHALLRGLTGVFLEKPGLTLCAAALVSMFSSTRSKRIGDLLAGTVVLQQRVPAQVSQAPPMPPPLAAWASTLDLSRLSDDLALSVRRFLSRAHQLNPGAREDLGSRLAASVTSVVTPPPPQGTPGWAYLSAVLAERRRREELRLAEQSYAEQSYAGKSHPPPSYAPRSYAPRPPWPHPHRPHRHRRPTRPRRRRPVSPRLPDGGARRDLRPWLGLTAPRIVRAMHEAPADEPVARKRTWEYDTPTGRPCPRTVRPDGSIDGDGACHQCGMGPACPLFDPWAEGILD